MIDSLFNILGTEFRGALMGGFFVAIMLILYLKRDEIKIKIQKIFKRFFWVGAFWGVIFAGIYIFFPGIIHKLSGNNEMTVTSHIPKKDRSLLFNRQGEDFSRVIPDTPHKKYGLENIVPGDSFSIDEEQENISSRSQVSDRSSSDHLSLNNDESEPDVHYIKMQIRPDDRAYFTE